MFSYNESGLLAYHINCQLSNIKEMILNQSKTSHIEYGIKHTRQTNIYGEKTDRHSSTHSVIQTDIYRWEMLDTRIHKWQITSKQIWSVLRVSVGARWSGNILNHVVHFFVKNVSCVFDDHEPRFQTFVAFVEDGAQRLAHFFHLNIGEYFSYCT